MTLFSGALSDRLGRKRTLLLGSSVGIVMGALFFPLVDTAIPAVVFLAILIVRLGIATMWGPWGAMISEQFNTNVRYTAIGVCTSLSSIIGAQTPSISALLAAGSQRHPVPVGLPVPVVGRRLRRHPDDSRHDEGRTHRRADEADVDGHENGDGRENGLTADRRAARRRPTAPCRRPRSG